MKKVIGVSGKGGVGKTIISSLLVRLLYERGNPSILAIDADPDLNLPQAMGIDFVKTVGDIMEDLQESLTDMKPHVKDEVMQFETTIMEILAETERCDLLVMGTPERTGCYCPVNHMIKTVIDTLSVNYDYTVIDCEAGLEHISRRTTRGVNTMFLVTDASVKGIQCVDRINKIVKNDSNLEIRDIHTIANRVPEGMEDKMRENAKEYNIDLIDIIPFDNLITQYDIEGKPMWDLPDDSPVVKSVKQIIEKVL